MFGECGLERDVFGSLVRSLTDFLLRPLCLPSSFQGLPFFHPCLPFCLSRPIPNRLLRHRLRVFPFFFFNSFSFYRNVVSVARAARRRKSAYAHRRYWACSCNHKILSSYMKRNLRRCEWRPREREKNVAIHRRRRFLIYKLKKATDMCSAVFDLKLVSYRILYRF